MRITKKRRRRPTSFIDDTDRRWTITITPDLIDEINEMFDLDFSEPIGTPYDELAEEFTDIEGFAVMVDLIWVCIRGQADDSH